MRELIRGNQQRLLSRDLDRVLDLDFPRVLITDGVNSPVMPMPLRGDRHCERLPAAPACIPKGVSRLDDAERIRERHRTLIAHSHPDAGGSDTRAADLNKARDLLLDDLNNKRR